MSQTKICVYCGKELDIDFFFDNSSPYMKEGKMLYCCECSGIISNDMICSDVSVNRAIRKMCSFFNTPYWGESALELREYVEAKKELYEKKNKSLQEMNCLEFYLKSLASKKLSQKYWQDLSGMGYLGYTLLRSTATKEQESDLDLFEELEKQWGKQEDIADYIFLTDKYNGYAKSKKLTPAAKTVVRLLCLAELDVQHGRDNREDTSKAEERVMKYYKALGLNNFNMSDEKPAWEKLIEDWAIIEETKNPIEWLDEQMEDVCHFREDNAEIMRCIGNVALGNKNYPNLALEDLEKYSKRNEKQK